MARRRMLLSLLVIGTFLSISQAGAYGATDAFLAVDQEAYPIIPDPPFAVPPGGRSELEVFPGLSGSKTALFRVDGSLFAEQIKDEKGRNEQTTFYDKDGYPTLILDADPAADDSEARAPSYSEGDALLASAPLGEPYAWLASHILCGANDQNNSAGQWTTTMNWYINTGSIPDGINVDNTISHLRSARIAWEDNVTWCAGIGDSSSMNFTYQGSTGASYGDNGLNTVGWGSLNSTSCDTVDDVACSRQEVACARICTIVEADIRFDVTDSWINGENSCCYDIWTVGVHETGHNIGLQHVSATSPNVMCNPCQRKNDTSGRKLGKGDANLNNSKY